MKPFFIITKRTLAVILAVAIIILLVLSRVFSVQGTEIDGSTNQKRLIYIKSLGLEVDDSKVTSKEIIIPQSFNSVYKEYNALQKQAGFDLSEFKSKKAALYTYPMGDKREVHLIIYKGEIIGGDIADLGVNGNMKSLMK